MLRYIYLERCIARGRFNTTEKTTRRDQCSAASHALQQYPRSSTRPYISLSGPYSSQEKHRKQWALVSPSTAVYTVPQCGHTCLTISALSSRLSPLQRPGASERSIPRRAWKEQVISLHLSNLAQMLHYRCFLASCHYLLTECLRSPDSRFDSGCVTDDLCACYQLLRGDLSWLGTGSTDPDLSSLEANCCTSSLRGAKPWACNPSV